MCWDLEPRPGTTSVASLGWILYCPPPHPQNPNQPLPSASLSPTCHSLTLAWAFITHIKKIGVSLHALWHRKAALGRTVLAPACQLHWYLAGGQRPQLSWSKPFAHPQARYLVSCRGRCGKGRSLAQLPYPAPGFIGSGRATWQPVGHPHTESWAGALGTCKGLHLPWCLREHDIK